MAFDLSTPINTALLLYILYTVQRILIPSNAVSSTIPTEFKNGYSWMPKGHPPTLLFKTYTPKTLEPFNGENGQRILLAIKGIVYDVTAGRNFYGPSESWTSEVAWMQLTIACADGMYANFAGRDASRGMAKQSFDDGALWRYLRLRDGRLMPSQICSLPLTNPWTSSTTSLRRKCTFCSYHGPTRPNPQFVLQ